MILVGIWLAVIIIIWAIFRPRPSPAEKSASEKELQEQRRYNAQQWVDRNQQVIKKAAVVQRPHVRAASVPVRSPVASRTPTPAPKQDDGNELVSAMAGFVVASALSSNNDDRPSESCSSSSSSDSFSSGGGGDFGGGGASSSWD